MERWRYRFNLALTLGFFLVPVAAYLLVAAGAVEGVPAIGALLGVLGMIALLIVKTIVFGVIEYVGARRFLRRQLSDAASCRLRGRPDPADIAVGGFLLFGSLLFLLFAVTVLNFAEDTVTRAWVASGVFAMALGFQIVGLQRIGDYFLARRAWKETRND